MPLRRQLSVLTAFVAALALWAGAPTTADAASISGVAAGTVTSGEAVVADAVEPARPEPSVPESLSAPPPDSASNPVDETVAPIAPSAAATVPTATAAALPSGRFQERTPGRTSRIAATAARRRADLPAHPATKPSARPDRLDGATGSPSTVRLAGEHRPAPIATGTPAAPASPAGAAPAPPAGSPGAAASASAGFSSAAGGVALGVALLLLAGSLLRRRLWVPPAAFRSAAFQVVLERPG